MVAVAVAVAIGCLRGIIVERIAVIADPVTVCVRPLGFIVGEFVTLVAVAVAVRVVIDDFNRVG